MHWLKEWRKARGLTAAQLAAQVRSLGGGCSEALIVILEGGGVTHPEIAERIAALTGCTQTQKGLIVPKKYRGMNRAQLEHLRAERERERAELLAALCTVKPKEKAEKPKSSTAGRYGNKEIVKISRDGRELARYHSTELAAVEEEMAPSTIRDKCRRGASGARSAFTRHGATWLYAKDWDAMDEKARADFAALAKKEGRKRAR